MRKVFGLVCALVLFGSASPAHAVLLHEDFESGVAGSPIEWTKWTGANQEILQSATDIWKNKTPGGDKSARAYEASPTGYSAYAGFGLTTGMVKAEVWLFEDFNRNGLNSSEPVTNMLALAGGSGSTMDFSNDYLQLGVVNFHNPGGVTSHYSIRTKYNDDNALGYILTGVPRKSGWTKLGIEADAHADGGAVRFYIDDNLVGSSFRKAGTELGFVRLGNNSASYENFWYDEVTVVPEPSSIALLGLGGLAMAGYTLRRRRAARG